MDSQIIVRFKEQVNFLKNELRSLVPPRNIFFYL